MSGLSTLAVFDGTHGSSPNGALVADVNGNLFGVTTSGGASGDGMIFELQNAGTVAIPSYASTATVLASFDGTYVVDASLAAAWFLPDEQNDAADQVIAELGVDPGRALSLFWFKTRNLFPPPRSIR